MSKRAGGVGRGVKHQQMGRQNARATRDRTDYQALLNQAANDFIDLNPKLDWNNPENFNQACKDFSEKFLPKYSSRKTRDSVATAIPRYSKKISLGKVALVTALVLAGLLTEAAAKDFQKDSEKALPDYDKKGDTVSRSSRVVATPSAPRHGNLRGAEIVPLSPPPHESRARELPAKPPINQYQLTDFIDSQRDPSNPTKMISLAPLTATYQTDPSGLLTLPDRFFYAQLSYVDFSHAKIGSNSTDAPACFEPCTDFQNSDLTGASFAGQGIRVSFENCKLDTADFSNSQGHVVIGEPIGVGTSETSVQRADFSGANIELRIASTSSNFTGTTFEGATLNQQTHIVSHRGTSSAVGLDLTGATVVLDTGERVEATSPLVITDGSDAALKISAHPGKALQTGAADRPIEVTLTSDTAACQDYHSTSVAPVALEEFAETLQQQLYGYNIAVTTSDSETSSSAVKSSMNLCTSGSPAGQYHTIVFPELSTQIIYDNALSPTDAQASVIEKVLRAFGMEPDTAVVYRMSSAGTDLPTQNPSYLPVMTHKYLQAFAGKNPALAGCTMSVGLNPGEFKIVAGDVEMSVDPKICGAGNALGYDCRFNQVVTAYDGQTQKMLIQDLGVSLNTIEKDGEIEGYVIAVDGASHVNGTVTTDTSHCPTPSPAESGGIGTVGIVGMSIAGAMLACVCAGYVCKKRKARGADQTPAVASAEGIEMTERVNVLNPLGDVVVEGAVDPDTNPPSTMVTDPHTDGDGTLARPTAPVRGTPT